MLFQKCWLIFSIQGPVIVSGRVGWGNIYSCSSVFTHWCPSVMLLISDQKWRHDGVTVVDSDRWWMCFCSSELVSVSVASMLWLCLLCCDRRSRSSRRSWATCVLTSTRTWMRTPPACPSAGRSWVSQSLSVAPCWSASLFTISLSGFRGPPRGLPELSGARRRQAEGHPQVPSLLSHHEEMLHPRDPTEAGGGL